MRHFKLRLNEKSSRLVKSFFVVFLVVSWLLTGFPSLYISPKFNFPPKIKEALAANVSATHLVTSASTSNAQSYTTASITPSANALVLAWIENTHASSASTITLSGNGLTWVQVNTLQFNGTLNRITLFRAMGASPTAGAVTITVAGTSNTGAAWSITQFTNVDTSGTNGSGAVVQSVTNSATAATSLAITLAALGQSINATAGGFGINLNSLAITPGTGYTELGELNYNTPATDLESEWKQVGSTTVDVTNTSGNIGGIAVEIKAVPTTTLGSGTDPASSTIAPGAAITDADAFTLSTDAGTDSVTALTVTLAGSGTPYQGLAEVRITSDNGATLYFAAVTTFSSNTVNFSGGVPIPVSTTSTQFKIRITPLSHANMPVPPGASYALSPIVSSMTTTNLQAGSDTMANTITIDNLSPNGATLTSGSAGNTAVTLNWTSSSSTDFDTTNGSVILRWAAASAGTEVPAEGNSSYTAGNTITTATVACVISSATSTALSKIDGAGGSVGCTTTALTNGQAYTYKAFQRDTNGNYDVGVSIGTFTPAAAVSTFTQNKYRWYQDNNLADPTTPWGNPALAENTAITVIPAGKNPPDSATALRLRVNYVVNTVNLPVSSNYFKLEFKAGTDGSCATGTWTDVGTGAWAYGTSTVTDGSNINAVLSDTTTGLGEQYAKSKPTAVNHVAATTTQIIEYDFHIVGTSSTANTTYSFRVVGTNSTGSTETIFDAYTNCPTLTTQPGTSDLMRHGNVFTNGSEQGFFWAN